MRALALVFVGLSLAGCGARSGLETARDAEVGAPDAQRCTPPDHAQGFNFEYPADGGGCCPERLPTRGTACTSGPGTRCYYVGAAVTDWGTCSVSNWTCRCFAGIWRCGCVGG